MTLPVTLSDLGTYLNDTINPSRGQLILDLTHTLCESIVNPLPAGAEGVVLDVAQRAYALPPEGVGPFATIAPPTMGAGGLFLTRSNTATLRRLAGRGGAFTIDTTPAAAGQNLPWWDTGTAMAGFDTGPLT